MARKPAFYTEEDLTPRLKIDNDGRIIFNIGAQRLFRRPPIRLLTFDSTLGARRFLTIIPTLDKGYRCAPNGRTVRVRTQLPLLPMDWVPCWYDDENKAVWAEIPK